MTEYAFSDRWDDRATPPLKSIRKGDAFTVTAGSSCYVGEATLFLASQDAYHGGPAGFCYVRAYKREES